MIGKICEKTPYGDVLSEPIHLRNAKTYMYIVRQLAGVSFNDSSIDSKGAAFEYYVRATLKGKKLGQYFTPRPVVHLMSILIGQKKIINSLAHGKVKVLDPACGTGGFLVFLLQQNRGAIQAAYEKGELTSTARDSLTKRLLQETFYGGDANDGVASAAKMNMIIAGDGHTNIQPEDSLTKSATLWSVDAPDVDVLITNPPFGTSETESLTADDMAQFPVRSGKGQHLFLQKMVICTVPGGDICTVIDEGVLNTESGADLRKWVFQHCRVKAIVLLPEETFKPNKINVRSSVVWLQKREIPDIDQEDNYNVKFIRIESLGYYGSGDLVRGFDTEKLHREVEDWIRKGEGTKAGYQWSGFSVESKQIVSDSTCRLDLKYWNPTVRDALMELKGRGHPAIGNMNLIETRRGKSPPADTYVDRDEGFALVVKAGSNISRFGELIAEGDYIEKNIFEDYASLALQDGDILVASTGTGTLGKCCVFRADIEAIPDGHVTVIRLDQERYYPEYVCDYMRIGFGHIQIQRLFTGSTGLIELTPDQVESVLIEVPESRAEQIKISKSLRAVENEYRKALSGAEAKLAEARQSLFKLDPGLVEADDSEAGDLDAG